jgi:hypothetical protein
MQIRPLSACHGVTYKRALPDPLRYGFRLRSEDRNDAVRVLCDEGLNLAAISNDLGGFERAASFPKARNDQTAEFSASFKSERSGSPPPGVNMGRGAYDTTGAPKPPPPKPR